VRFSIEGSELLRTCDIRSGYLSGSSQGGSNALVECLKIVTKISSFVGLVGYYRRFIEGLSKTVKINLLLGLTDMSRGF